MTLSSATNRWDYTGNGAVDTYAYTKKIFANTDLVVTVADTDGDETTLVLTTDYTVTGVGETTGGNVVLVNSSQAWLDGDGDLKSGYELVIRRVRPLTQETDIRNQGTFYPEAHEDAFDHLMMCIQQLQEQIDRCVSASVTGTVIDQDTLNETLADVLASEAAAAASASAAASSASAASSSASSASSSASAASSSASSASASAASAASAVSGLYLQSKVVSFTRDTSVATGTQAVTGVGFEPDLVVFLSVQSGGSNEVSIGADNASEAKGMGYQVASSNWGQIAANSIADYESGANEYLGKISVMGADGFTVSWTKTGSPTGTLNIVAVCLKIGGV